uniref:Uncharacterized protein n=1 Tax=uncultured marine virus TaxID=186617 RepID=A0A0F7L6H6_9VIRU|nr:hypothetical protein [uncultured marine virus]
MDSVLHSIATGAYDGSADKEEGDSGAAAQGGSPGGGRRRPRRGRCARGAGHQPAERDRDARAGRSGLERRAPRGRRDPARRQFVRVDVGAIRDRENVPGDQRHGGPCRARGRRMPSTGATRKVEATPRGIPVSARHPELGRR